MTLLFKSGAIGPEQAADIMTLALKSARNKVDAAEREREID